MSRIHAVVLFQNGMVMVFDKSGDQMSAYQGRLADVRDRILRDAPADARFQEGVWGHSLDDRDRAWFETRDA